MDKVALIVINRDRPNITDNVVEQIRGMGEGLDTYLFVVEAGSRPGKRSKYATHHFRDRSYKGRYYAFNKGLKFAHKTHPSYDYYWFVVNDIIFPEDQDTLRLLYDAMQEDERMGCIGPGEPEANTPTSCTRRTGSWPTPTRLSCTMTRVAVPTELSPKSRDMSITDGQGISPQSIFKNTTGKTGMSFSHPS